MRPIPSYPPPFLASLLIGLLLLQPFPLAFFRHPEHVLMQEVAEAGVLQAEDDLHLMLGEAQRAPHLSL